MAEDRRALRGEVVGEVPDSCRVVHSGRGGVEKAGVRGTVAGELRTEEGEFGGVGIAHVERQQGTVEHRRQADVDLGEGEDRVPRRHPKVGAKRDLQAGSDGVVATRADDNERSVAERLDRAIEREQKLPESGHGELPGSLEVDPGGEPAAILEVAGRGDGEHRHAVRYLVDGAPNRPEARLGHPVQVACVDPQVSDVGAVGLPLDGDVRARVGHGADYPSAPLNERGVAGDVPGFTWEGGESRAMTDRAGRNRLDEEASPYLKQHADNPVHWQPWDEAALAEAEARDVPIFLSVGYSACHWCHVMEEESFENETVAELLNEEYVPVKVDREERPDVDRVYMTVCQLVTGRGGWPLSAWLTPDCRPFYVGTYFPKEGGDGTPGFLDLLRDVAASWERDREELEQRANRWVAALEDDGEGTAPAAADPPDATLRSTVTDALLRSADREHGGFGRTGPKFPQPARVEALLWAANDGGSEPREVAVETLTAMANGGVYDQIGGGFHRYAVDRSWTVPHFEKMLYDSAELARVSLAAHRLTGAPRFATTAQETLAFLERELGHPEGAFYATLDARSDPQSDRTGAAADLEEGAFYVWAPDEVHRAVDDERTARLLCDRYGISEEGNFEAGTTVPTVAASRATLAARHDLEERSVRRQLLAGRQTLFEARSERPRPRRDEKVLAGWNGLAVSAFAAGGRTLDPALAGRARDALGFVRDHLWSAGDRHLSRRYKDGDVKVDGCLEDYAFLGRGALDCYQATGDVEPLAFSLALGRAVVDRFFDADDGTLYFTPEDGPALVSRPQDPIDQSTPSSLGVATHLLLALDPFAPDAGFEETAETVLSTHQDRIEGNPTEHATLTLAADRLARGGTEIVVAADELPEPWWETLSGQYLPTSTVSVRPPTDDDLDPWLDALGLDEIPPVWRGREARDGEPTVYACRDRTCSPPEEDVAAALHWLRENVG